jgi:RNA polymerase-binding transcription factor DksA
MRSRYDQPDIDDDKRLNHGPMAVCAKCEREFSVERGEQLPIRPWCPSCVDRYDGPREDRRAHGPSAAQMNGWKGL